MPASVHVVGVVVDPEYGDRLRALASRMPVWIADSDPNRVAVAALRREGPSGLPHTAIGAVTVFDVDQEVSQEAWVLSVLGDIDLHHGEHSHVPPYTALEVFGVEATHDLRVALAEYGLTEIEPRPGGFLASVHRVA